MNRITGPGWRLAGAAVSWMLFTFNFSLLYQASSVVMGLGGFCASGGPYVISTQCPEVVVIFAPLSIFGGMFAVAVGLVVARGFAAPLVVWAWPILFVGLGIAFAISALQPGGIMFGIIAVVFIAMGLAPFAFEVRAGPRRVILGKTDVRDRRFRERENAPRTLYVFGRNDQTEAVDPTPADWALGLSVWLGSATLGVWLGIQAFTAVAAAG